VVAAAGAEAGAGGGQQAQKAVGRLAAGVGIVAVQAVQAGTGMGVENGDGAVFLGQVLQRGHQHQVLEHVGMVAGVKGVAITEHGAMVTRQPRLRAYNRGLRSAHVAPRRSSNPHLRDSL
jgi:hypothetical protein